MESNDEAQRQPSGRGGWRPGAGRKKGSVNRASEEARKKAKETGELPHEFMLRVMRGEVIERKHKHPDTGQVVTLVEEYDFDKRLDAAKAAAPYYAPKISQVQMIGGMGDDDLDRLIAEFAREAGFGALAGGEGEEDEDQGGEGGGRGAAPARPRRGRIPV